MRILRSTPIARLSCSEKFFECFASTGLNAPGTMRQFCGALENGPAAQQVRCRPILFHSDCCSRRCLIIMAALSYLPARLLLGIETNLNFDFAQLTYCFGIPVRQ